MTNEEARAIIRKEYLCVDRDCDIERSCGKCDLAMPSKEPILEAFKMAMQALETIPKYKDTYGKGWDDGAKATYEHLKMCEEEQGGDLISRDAVIDITWEEPSYTDALNVLTEVRDKVKVLPSVNPQEKTGHWIRMKAYEKWRCSECNTVFRFTFKEHDFCPSCGARMESEKNE